MTANELQSQGSITQIPEVGGVVRLVTANGDKHKFRIAAISEDYISGKDQRIAIHDIVAIETREFSATKTIGLVGATVLALSATRQLVVDFFDALFATD